MITEQKIGQMKQGVRVIDTTSLVPIVRKQSLENSIWYMGHLMTFLATGEETGGRLALIEAVAKKGNGPPRHVHYREDELFYVLEGEVMIFVGDETIKATAGMSAFLPRGIPHSFNIESEQARTLILITPAGFENWFTEFGEPAQSLTLPPMTEPSYADVERMMEVGERYGIEFLPPAR